MIWATVSCQYYFCCLYRASPFSASNNIINLILVSTIWWCPCVESFLCCSKRVFAMASAFSWQNSLSLCPASLCTPRQIFLLPQVFLDFYFCIPVPCNEKDVFFGVSSKRSCRSSYNCSASASSALLVGAQTWITVILNGVCLGNEEILLSFLRLHPSTSFRTLVDHDGYSISSKGFLPTVIDIMVIWVKFTHSSPS